MNQLEQIKSALMPDAQQWLESAIADINSSTDIDNDLLNLSARARRKCKLNYDEHAELIDNIRLLLIQTAIDKHTQAAKEIISNYYRYGDEQEKAAILKALSKLDPTGDAFQVAINACRANSFYILEAAMLDNEYPSKHFPELNWNQLVLKALFQGLDISRVKGLNDRQNPKLSQMAYSYAEEQILARREPPASIWLAIRLTDVDEKAKELFEQYESHENKQHGKMIALAKAQQNIN